MRVLAPAVLVVIGIISGAGVGLFLREDAPESFDGTDVAKPNGDQPRTTSSPSNGVKKNAFVKLNNQFVVPVIHENKVSALVVLSITLETIPEETEYLYNLEPKIRDAALRVLFEHAYLGGFDGQFTISPKLDTLREALFRTLSPVSDNKISNVLITDIIRQDT